ncbi:MAG: polysaccharide deacetylase family protein [Gillisia sp.]
MAYLKKISTLGKVISPSLVWNIPNAKNTLYLSFDDGPIPEVTPWVLKMLKKYDAKATFFCIGENVKKHPEVFQEIISAGHRIGNHTYNHLNGWNTSTEDYFLNFQKAEEILQQEIRKSESRFSNELFRPPYGKIKPAQIKRIQKYGHKIVMWEVISGDFDANLSAEECYKNVIGNCKSGSIVVFHDSLKAEKNLRSVLPEVLEFYKQKGFSFKTI